MVCELMAADPVPNGRHSHRMRASEGSRVRSTLAHETLESGAGWARGGRACSRACLHRAALRRRAVGCVGSENVRREAYSV